jgi:hypothetical protein
MSIMRPKAHYGQILGAAVAPVLGVFVLGSLGAWGAAACANTTETAQLHIVPAIILDSGPMAIEPEDASAFGLALAGDAGRCSAPGATSARAFGETFEQGSGFLTIHYPDTFDVNPDSDTLTFLNASERAGVSTDSLVTFTTNPEPISQVVEEYAKAMQGAREKALTNYALISKQKTCCLHDLIGIETRWKFDEVGSDGPVPMQARACMVIREGHGYSVMYSFDPKRPADEAKLRAIVDAVEFTSASDEQTRSSPSEPSRPRRRRSL